MNNTQYFYRTIIFTRQDNQIGLADISNPDNVTPLDTWLGTVLSLADGRHSIQELIDYLGSGYPEGPPENLESTLHSVIDRLLEGGFIKLSPTPVELPYYLDSPIEELDLEKARSLIQEDGYALH